MGLAELFVIAVVGLIVIGPDKLPETIKTCLVWISRVKRIVTTTRSELEHQLGVDEIRREIHNEEVMASLNALKTAQQDIEQGSQGVTDAFMSAHTSIKENFEPEDEGLFGDQQANHPKQDTQASDQDSHSTLDSSQHNNSTDDGASPKQP